MKLKISKKRLILISSILVIILGTMAYTLYSMAYASNFNNKKPYYLYINREMSFDTICQILADSAQCHSISSFRQMASLMQYPQHIKTGRYRVNPGSSNRSLLQDLQSGHQQAIRLTFNNLRTKQDLTEKLDQELMLTADELNHYLNDTTWCDSLGFTPETITTLFIPNTYEIYWNTSAAKFLARMKKEYDCFWNPTRIKKAQDAGLTPIEVSILASIVEEETAAADEYPLVAGLYINRLRKGIPLQADPTVKFAWGDFTLQRILFSHLEIDSPYNTYKHTGLPPGPLRIPSIQGIDGVLNYTHHTYIYMCAKEDLSGRHNFARTLAEHTRNAQRYQAELNRRKIR